jgi:16S rRNA processing protein RimM
VTAEARLVTAGRVGRPHGLDGSFYVLDVQDPLPEGLEVTVAGAQTRIERRRGTDQRPLVRLEGVSTHEAAAALGGELLLTAAEEPAAGEDEWLASELVGCEVGGLGVVARVIDAPSCDVLELEDGTLVPLVSDALRSVDVAGRTIEVDLRFLGLEPRE